MKTPKNLIMKHFLLPFKKISPPKNGILVLFTLEGMLITLVNNLINNNNNLFATRLGANEFQLGLIFTIPQLIAMLALIPGGILTDRMNNKQNMVTSSLFFIFVSYIAIGFVPFIESFQFIVFLILLAVSVGFMTIYNVSWQAYFSDIVNIEERNHIITIRTALTFLINIIIPFICGSILSYATTNNSKIRIHQLFFWIGSILLLIQIVTLKKIKVKPTQPSSSINIKQFKHVLMELLHNKKFLGFVGVALFFYTTWHIDWTLYFIGQVNYLNLNEAWLSYVSIGGAIVQFLTIGFWSRMNNKRGVRFGIIFGNIGLALCPISMIISTSLEHGKLVFLILNTLSNFAFATVNMNILQCLLQVIPEKNKTLNISLYTILVTLSNAIMPLVGVTLYTYLGGHLQALQTTFGIIFGLRIISSSLWFLRWKRLGTWEK